jgi:hypothetical protein
MGKPILVFPAGMPRSLTYLESAQAAGKTVIGSSSLGNDPVRERYPLWVRLPYVTSPDFDDALRCVISQFDIGGIFTPNPVVWDYINKKIKDTFPGTFLVNCNPIDSELTRYHKALQFEAEVLSEPLQLSANGNPKPIVSELVIASLFLHAESIPGMCDHEKIRALTEIFRYTPLGDVVEIGTWWGKSAFVLNWLAGCYNVGKLLCIDPWSSEHIIQNDENGFVDGIRVDANEALTVFHLNLLPYAQGRLNYLRLPSVEAAKIYRMSLCVTSPEFGVTQLSGSIAVLHIDGNHNYDNVRSDIEVWSNRVVPGGWIIIDDYLWPYGDGPQRAGDEFLAAKFDSIELAFVMGGALFLRLFK